MSLLNILHAWLRHFTAATTCAPHPTLNNNPPPPKTKKSQTIVWYNIGKLTKLGSPFVDDSLLWWTKAEPTESYGSVKLDQVRVLTLWREKLLASPALQTNHKNQCHGPKGPHTKPPLSNSLLLSSFCFGSISQRCFISLCCPSLH